MGYSSRFEHEDIEITDLEGLKAFLKHWDETFQCGYSGTMLTEFEGKYDFTFESWDDYKIVSYWCSDTIYFLKGISKFIKGYVCFIGEDNNMKAEIYLENNTFRVEEGEMNYHTYPADYYLEPRKDDVENQKYRDFLAPYMI